MKLENVKRFIFTVPTDLHAGLVKVSNKKGLSMSELLRNMIREEVKKEKCNIEQGVRN